MSVLPEIVIKSWKDREGPSVLTTVDKKGIPNSIYVSCVNLFGDDRVVIANNYFNKTLKNIKDGSRGSLLFITSERKSFQIKGRIEYHESGEIYDDMKTWNPTKHPGHAAAAIKVEEVYSGADKLL